ncbi:MAG TPA: TetR/AcrR family transcriptional regulator C-terminal domain-containing protein [Jatrophihabitantaceae bacterium]
MRTKTAAGRGGRATHNGARTAKEELNRDAVVDRALAIADVEGLDAVTIRRLATEFGVTPMALYWHVSNKDELLAAMGDRLFADIDVDALVSTGPWQQQLRRITAALVRALRAHPAAAMLGAQRVLFSETGCELAERVLQLLVKAGFGIGTACDIASYAMQTAVMLVAQRPGEPTSPADERDAVTTAKREAIAQLPRDRFPLLVESAEALTSTDDEDAYYRFGIDLFIAGVEGIRPKGAKRAG